MADTLIKMKTGTISKLEEKNSNGTPVVSLEKGTVYFAIDTSNHLGKIVYDAPTISGGTDRIVMSTQAEYAEQANIAQNVSGVIGIDHGGTGGTTASTARSNLGLGNGKIFIGQCSTAGATTAKKVTCAEFTSNDLVKGSVILVSFDNTNSGTVDSLTLNVNNTGAKSIKKYYNRAINNLTHVNELVENSIIPFVYNGTYWIAFGLDYNSTFSVMSQTEATAGTATTGRVITAKVLHDTIADSISDSLSDNNAMIYKGIITSATDIPDIHEAGWTYKVATAGTYAGEKCEIGDLVICVVDGTTADDDDWIVIQKNVNNALFKDENTFTNEHMLLADGTDGKVKSVAINPALTLTAGTSSVAPKFKISVGGKTSTESTMNTATTGVYGATKLSSTVSSTEEGLAATPKGVNTAVTNAINTLNISDSADSTKYVSAVSESNGKIAVSRALFNPSITVTSGDNSGAPKINVTVAGNSGTAQSLNTATTGVYGVTKLSNTSSTTEEGLAATPKGVWTAINTLDGTISGTPSAAKTLTAFSQTNGKVSATFGNIAIAASQVTSGTLSVARGGTGQTSVADIQAGKDSEGNTITSTYATKAELNDLLALNDAMIFKGTITSQTDIPNPPYDAGWTYKIETTGTYVGKICETGDLLICVHEKGSGATAEDSDWIVVQTNLDNGLFKGINTFTDGYMLLADGTVGKVKAVNINPTINMTGGTSSAAPQFTISVGGKTSSSASIGTATTGVYGTTKLSDAINSTSTSLAATANAVKKAYDLAASKTSNVGTITGVTAGAGLTGGGTSGNITIGHSNSITAITTEDLYKIKFDDQGHITGALSVGITDNSASKAVTSTDTNLITARTLYYAGYTKNTGTVTSVTLDQGDGITISNSGTAITTSGSRTIAHAVPSGASASTKGTTGRTYIQTITTDQFGHVTGYTTGTETVTDTHHQAKGIVTNSATKTSQTTSALTNGNVYYNIIENGAVRSAHKISGANVIGVTSDSSGNLSVAHTVPSGASAGSKGSTGRTYLQTITTDDYGHITGYTTGTETVTNSDTKVNVTLATTTKAYLLGTSTTPTSTAQGVTAVADTGVYLDTTAGKLTATSFAGNGASLTSLNASNLASGTVAVERFPTSAVTAGTYQGITVDKYGRVTGAVNQGYTTNTGTVTSITIKGGEGITVDSTSAITTSGTRTITHASSEGASATTYNGGTNNAGKLIRTITTDKFGHVTAGTTGSLVTTSIGSASAGTAISADDITDWIPNTPTVVEEKTVVTSASYASGVLTLSTGDSVNVTPGTAATLQHTSRTIPNISVTNTTVATGAIN